MAIPLTTDMLSDMKNMLDHLQWSINDTFKHAISLEEKYDIEIVSNANGSEQNLE